MSNPFSTSGASMGSSLSGIGQSLNPGGAGGGAGAGIGSQNQQPGLMSLWNQISNQSTGSGGPGLYKPQAPGNIGDLSQIATSPEPGTMMNEMQSPAFQSTWGTNTNPWASASPSVNAPAWGQPTQ